MSWMKKRGQPSPAPSTSAVPMYNPNQQQWQQTTFQPVPSSDPQYPSNNLYTQPPKPPTPSFQHQQSLPPSQLHQPASGNYWQLPNTPQHQQTYPQQQNYGIQQNANPYQRPPSTNSAQYQQQSNYNQYSQPVNQGGYYQNTQFNSNPPTQSQNFYPNSYYNTQPLVQNPPPQKVVDSNVTQDSWNWGWAEESNSGKEENIKTQHVTNQQNANRQVGAAFDDSWNWTVDDSNPGSVGNNYVQDLKTVKKEGVDQQQVFEKMGPLAAKHKMTKTEIDNNNDVKNTDENILQPMAQQMEPNRSFVGYNVAGNNYQQDLKAVSKNEVVDQQPLVQQLELNRSYGGLDQMPSYQTGRRAQNDNLTPQWSIESQVSQDSSDDILQTSESDNRSNKLSRSSTISQSPSLPNSGQETAFDAFSPSIKEEPRENTEYKSMSHNVEYMVQNHEVNTMVGAVQNLSLRENIYFENKEIPTPELNSACAIGPIERTENLSIVDSSDSSTTLRPIKELTPPLAPPKMSTPPLSDLSNNINGNPYKRTTLVTHNSINKYRKSPVNLASGSMSDNKNIQRQNSFDVNTDPINFNQVVKLEENYESRQNIEMGVNLETVPDNSEQPDQSPTDVVRQYDSREIPSMQLNQSNQQQWSPVENCEIAPKNDRNQYLETGQLSENDLLDFTQNNTYSADESYHTSDLSAEINFEEPPPGLSRMVLGRTEPEIRSTLQNSDRVVPTGLDRVIDGEPENNDGNNIQTISNNDLPVGFRRMIPGESSSPETRAFRYQSPNYDDDDLASEAELRAIGTNALTQQSQRSETIGADTPPANQSSGDLFSDHRDVVIGSDMIEPELRETDLDGADTREENITAIPDQRSGNNRTADGGPQENIQRIQTDGENTTDQERKHSRNRKRSVSSDDEENIRDHSSERRRKSSPGRYRDDRRHHDRDDRRHRDSPDRYFDRRHDRRRHDRYYEEDTDYYSDKERRERRGRDSRERDEYDRRYSSLRKDKDRGVVDRRRDRDRRDYDRDGRRDDYYYGRYEDDYYGRESRGSRPTSRTDSYRDRELGDRDRDPTRKQRDLRDPYQSYYGYGGYTPYSPYYNMQLQQQQYQYLKDLRRTNPAAYAEWYHKYYQNAGSINVGSTAAGSQRYGHDDRASVHSGRSSANDEIRKERVLDHTDSSLNFEESAVSSQRLTPAKFTTAHIKGSISSGRLIKIPAHYPLDGQLPIVEIIDLQSVLADDPEQRELSEYPGPLIKGVTHKKTIIDYCEYKIKEAPSIPGLHDIDSYILMWELLILLLRQNGVVVGTDIAELLMKNHNSANSGVVSIKSSVESIQENQLTREDENMRSLAPDVREAEVTNEFRKLLIYGSVKEALEWAMKHSLWGHALFLASKLDKRTYTNVMIRFANGLPINDPLQTLYQLLSGRQPAAVTSVADKKWGPWRPHLAMILSNMSQKPELDRKAITTLGDTLFARGSLYAAHFCYLMAQVGFGKYGSSSARLVLLGSSHQKSFAEFATNDAISMTEIYEYACSLNDGSYVIPEFQSYKYLLACRLAERGFLERALLYTEKIGTIIASHPSSYSPVLADKVLSLAERLKARDPAALADIQLDNEFEGENLTEANWMTDLRAVLSDYNMGLICPETRSLSNLASSELDITQTSQTPPNDPNLSQTQQSWEQLQPHDQQQYYQPDQHQPIQQQIPPQQPQWGTVDQQHELNRQRSGGGYEKTEESYQNSVPYSQPEHQQQWLHEQQLAQQSNIEYYGNLQQSGDPQPEQSYQQNDYWSGQNQAEEPRPQITMPGSGPTNFGYPGDDLDDKTLTSKTSSSISPKKNTQAAKKVEKQNNNTGWFGGLWNKLSLKPKNQMILPDDKNPTIVWDPKENKWVNLDADGEDPNLELKPPPKMSDMFPKSSVNAGSLTVPPMPVQNPSNLYQNNSAIHNNNTMKPDMNDSGMNHSDENGMLKPTMQNNMFKMQRSKGVKKAYVDVFNNGAIKSNPLPKPDIFGANAMPAGGAQMNIFVPQTVTNTSAPTEFLTPANNKQDVSTDAGNSQDGGVPLMYNPNQFSHHQPTSTASRGRYPQN